MCARVFELIRYINLLLYIVTCTVYTHILHTHTHTYIHKTRINVLNVNRPIDHACRERVSPLCMKKPGLSSFDARDESIKIFAFYVTFSESVWSKYRDIRSSNLQSIERDAIVGERQIWSRVEHDRTAFSEKNPEMLFARINVTAKYEDRLLSRYLCAIWNMNERCWRSKRGRW